MKPLDKKDMPKLFALIGLSVGALGFGVWQFTSGAAVAGTPKPAEKHSTPAATPPPPSSEIDTLLAKVNTPGGGRDPFIPFAGGTDTPPPTPAPGKPGPGSPPLPNAQPGKRVVPPPGGFTFGGNGFQVGNASQSAPEPTPVPSVIVIPPPPPPQFSVSGVVVAEQSDGRSVAILRGGDSERRYVSVGDPVGNGFVVAAIRLDGVEIIDASAKKAPRRFTVKLSH